MDIIITNIKKGRNM